MTVGDVMGPALDKMCRPGGIGRVVECPPSRKDFRRKVHRNARTVDRF
jgi:hypothetical protein